MLPKIILASNSPRRKDLLKKLGLPYQARSPQFDEHPTNLLPEKECLTFAKGKALSLANQFPNHIIIGSDTMVVLNDEKIGKPHDQRHAFEILTSLSGKEHQVITALYMYYTAKNECFETLDSALVRFDLLTDQQINNYLQTTEPYDKAGAYAIQGKAAAFAHCIKGDIETVIGLCTHSICLGLKELGYPFN